MLKLNVPDMTCGHCAGVVTKAVKSVDSNAEVAVDLPSRTLTVRSPADESSVLNALEAAGYPARSAA